MPSHAESVNLRPLRLTDVTFPTAVPSAMRRATMEGRKSNPVAVATLTLLCLALYLPGLAVLPPIDRDEARFAQSTKQMLESGDFVVPRFQDGDRFNKPAGIYWLQAAAAHLAGRDASTIWPYRIPSVVGALVAVLLTYWIGRRFFAASVAFLGAALLASCTVLIVEAHLATTDAALLMCVLGAQGCLGVLYAAGRRGRRSAARYAIGFWIAQGCGILIKGPVLPLVSGLTMLALICLDRDREWLTALRWTWGGLLVSVIVLPWAVAAGVATDWAYYRGWIGGDILAKAVRGQELHGAPPGTYLVLLAVTFWPGSLLAAPGVLRAVQRRTRCGERFCLAWLIPTWLVFELMPTKLPHYVLPVYPALALLTARAALMWARPATSRLHAVAFRTGVAVWLFVTLGLAAAIVAGPVALGGPIQDSIIVALVAATIGMVVLGLCWRQRVVPAMWIAVIGTVVIVGPLLHRVLPGTHALWLSRTAAEAVARTTAGAHAGRRLAAVGYQEPSLVFLSPSPVAMLDAAAAPAFLQRGLDAVVLINEEDRPAFQRAADDAAVRVRDLWSTDGFNYSNGRRVRLHLFGRGQAVARGVAHGAGS